MKHFIFTLLAGTALALPMATASADVLSRNAASAAQIIPVNSTGSTTGGAIGGSSAGPAGQTGSNAAPGDSISNSGSGSSFNNTGTTGAGSASTFNNTGTTGAGSASDFGASNSGNVASGMTGATGTTGTTDGVNNRLSGAINGTQDGTFSAEAVTALQQTLQQRGVYNGDINGTFDANTVSALREYQRVNGLSATGQLDTNTVRNLGLANTFGDDMGRRIQSGTSTSAGINGNVAPGAIGIRAGVAADASTLDRDGVVTMQQALASNGFYGSRIDGQWGRNTTAALREFQRRNNLSVTGRLDAQTAQSLGITMQPSQ